MTGSAPNCLKWRRGRTARRRAAVRRVEAHAAQCQEDGERAVPAGLRHRPRRTLRRPPWTMRACVSDTTPAAMSPKHLGPARRSSAWCATPSRIEHFEGGGARPRAARAFRCARPPGAHRGASGRRRGCDQDELRSHARWAHRGAARRRRQQVARYTFAGSGRGDPHHPSRCRHAHLLPQRRADTSWSAWMRTARGSFTSHDALGRVIALEHAAPRRAARGRVIREMFYDEDPGAALGGAISRGTRGSRPRSRQRDAAFL